MSDENYELMTISEVSELTRVPVATLRWWRHAGQGPPAGKFGGRLMYRKSAVLKWIDKQFETEENK